MKMELKFGIGKFKMNPVKVLKATEIADYLLKDLKGDIPDEYFDFVHERIFDKIYLDEIEITNKHTRK